MNTYEQLLAGNIRIESDWRFVWDYLATEYVGEPEADTYVTSMCKCRMCGDERLSTWPINVLDDSCTECPNCGHMTCEPVTDDVVVLV